MYFFNSRSWIWTVSITQLKKIMYYIAWHLKYNIHFECFKGSVASVEFGGELVNTVLIIYTVSTTDMHTHVRTHIHTHTWHHNDALSEEPLTLILSLAYFCPQKESSPALHQLCSSCTHIWCYGGLTTRCVCISHIYGSAHKPVLVFYSFNQDVFPQLVIFEKYTEQYDWGSQLFYWAVVIKIHCVPLGCRAQFVSSAVIWQHFNPTWGQAWEFIYMAWGKKIEWAKLKKKKN